MKKILITIKLLVLSVAFLFAQPTHSIYPSATDASINLFNNSPHLVYVPAGTSTGKLHIFFPGSGGKPSGSPDYLESSQAHGLYTIGLMYPNSPSPPNQSCGALQNPKGPYLDSFCQEVWDGINRSPLTTVNLSNSISNRIIKLLQYLIANYPGEGWDQFYDSSGVHWEKIILSGHSQGGDHVAFALKYHPTLYRAICVSSPRNLCAGIAEEWGSLDVSKLFTFTHTGDSYNLQVPIYGRMGITTEPVSIDTTLSTSWGHNLITSRTAGVTNFHKCTLTLVDFEPVWIFLLTNNLP